MCSIKIITIFVCLAAFAGLSVATNCYVGSLGVFTSTSCPSFSGCTTLDTAGVISKACLVNNATCGTTVGSVKTTCCYTSLCNSGFSVNMSPFHLFLVVASYFIYAKLA